MNCTQVTIGAIVVICSWYVMMAVHEAGHCLGALTTGATIEAVEIPLAGFSRTDISGNRHPLLVVWAGPLFGATAPLAFLLFLGCVRRRLRHAFMFFVGFCLLANGAYIGAGAFFRAGDCRELLRHGAPLWLLVGFGMVSSAGGLYLWHRMGPPRGWFAAAENQEDRTSCRS